MATTQKTSLQRHPCCSGIYRFFPIFRLDLKNVLPVTLTSTHDQRHLTNFLQCLITCSLISERVHTHYSKKINADTYDRKKHGSTRER